MIDIEIKGYKAGYGGKDPMRAKAERLFGEKEMQEAKSYKLPESRTPASKPARRPFAKGGRIKKAGGGAIPMSNGGAIPMATGGLSDMAPLPNVQRAGPLNLTRVPATSTAIPLKKGGNCKKSKFATGGVAKLRLGQMSKKGLPINKRGSQTLRETF